MQGALKLESGATQKVSSELFISSQVAQGLGVIGDRWSFLILRDIYLGLNRFDDLRKSTGCSRGTLSARLKKLVNRKILLKKQYQEKPTRFEYGLTPTGLDLYSVVLMIWKWENTWAKGTAQQGYLPKTLVHEVCGKRMQPVYRCQACCTELDVSETSFTVRDKFDGIEQVQARSQRRSKSNSEKGGQLSHSNMNVLDCVGDRWTSLVIAAGFFGLQRFDDMANAIQIGTSVLADRLNLLVKTGVYNRVQYQTNPARFEYHLSEKGRDLYGHTIAIHEWAERNLIRPQRGLVALHHLPCNQAFSGEMVCSECEEVLEPQQVRYEKD